MRPIELCEVVKRRGRGRAAVQALRGVSLAVAAGELCLLEGPSGSGKTTLIAVAAGLLGADAGEVWLAGRPLHASSPAERRRLRRASVGFVFQRAQLLEQLSVLENILVQADAAGLSRRTAAREAARLLHALGLAELAGRRPAELSGGEEQRAAVARALVHAPQVVFADEPTASLDSANGRAVAALLRELARERGVAVLVATHDARFRELASRSVRLVDGAATEGAR